MFENLGTFLRRFKIILWNCLEYFHENFKKNVGKVNFALILGKLWRNFRVTINVHKGGNFFFKCNSKNLSRFSQNELFQLSNFHNSPKN